MCYELAETTWSFRSIYLRYMFLELVFHVEFFKINILFPQCIL